MGGWRLHLLIADDDPLAPELLARDDAIGIAVKDDEWPRNRDLTGRERRVLQLSADGRSIAQVARELFISPTTVKTHLRHAAEKLDVHGRAAAVAEALRRGLIV